MKYHFAQFNVAWLKNPLDHPEIVDFKNAIDHLHDLADRAPGFIWRYVAEGQSSATTVRPLGENGIINFTVWLNREVMADWVYRGKDHSTALRRRRDWFYPPIEANVVMWWIPAGHIPTLDEALDRLQYLRTYGPTPLAFTFKEKYEAVEAEAFYREPTTPSLINTSIGITQAERCIDAYINIWNQSDQEQRRHMLAQVMTDDGEYQDPTIRTTNRIDLAIYIGKIQSKYINGTLVRTTAVNVHHDVGYFRWRMLRADAVPLPESSDFVRFSKDGRIRSVIGFFGPQLPIPLV